MRDTLHKKNLRLEVTQGKQSRNKIKSCRPLLDKVKTNVFLVTVKKHKQQLKSFLGLTVSG